MKKPFFNSILFSLISLLMISTSTYAQERVVATVDGIPVLESQVKRALGKKANTEANRQVALNSVIDDILVQKAIQDSGVKITNAHIDAVIENIAAQNGLTYGQFLDAVEYQGIDIHSYRRQIANQLLMDAVRQQNFGRNLDVTREQVENLADKMLSQAKQEGKLKEVTAPEYEVRHILLKLNPLLNDNQAKAQLNQIRADILANKLTFAQAAKDYSKDYLSGANGGSLGYALPDMYVPAFQQAILNTKQGTISQPFKTEFGWHILEVTGKRQSDVTENAYRQKAYEQLVNAQLQEEAQNWVKGLRRGADIKYIND